MSFFDIYFFLDIFKLDPVNVVRTRQDMFAGTDLILFGPPEHAPNNSGTSHRAVVIQTAVRGVTVLVCASTGILFHGNVVGSVNSVSSEFEGNSRHARNSHGR